LISSRVVLLIWSLCKLIGGTVYGELADQYKFHEERDCGHMATMRLKEMQKQLTRLTVLLLMALTAASQAQPGCPDSCGSVSSIPYPFGIGTSSVNGENCFLEKDL